MTDKELLERAKEIKDTICNRRHYSGVFKQCTPSIDDVVHFRRGNFTHVLINGCYMGVAKRNPKEKDNPTIGKNVALHRAVKELLHEPK